MGEFGGIIVISGMCCIDKAGLARTSELELACDDHLQHVKNQLIKTIWNHMFTLEIFVHDGMLSSAEQIINMYVAWKKCAQARFPNCVQLSFNKKPSTSSQAMGIIIEISITLMHACIVISMSTHNETYQRLHHKHNNLETIRTTV